MSLDAVLDDRLLLRPVAIDDYAEIRHLHAAAMLSATVGVLSELEVAAFVRLVHSPDYPAILMKEDVFGAWLDGELVGTASWQSSAANGVTARIGSIFVRHPRYGIGRRLVTEVRGTRAPVGIRQARCRRHGQRGAVLRAARLYGRLARGQDVCRRLLAPRHLPQEGADRPAFRIALMAA